MMNEPLLDFSQIILDQSSDGIVITDQNGLILQANRAFANFYASTAPDLIGKLMWSVLPSDQHEKSQERFIEMFSSSESGTSFETIIPGIGESSILLETTTYFSQPVGKRTRMLALVRDVTEKRNRQRRQMLHSELQALRIQFEQLLSGQKQVEKELRDSQSELRKSQQLFESIAKNFPNGAINVLDKAYRIVFTDGNEYHKYNLNPADFIGQPIDVLFPNKDLTASKARYDKVFQGETQFFEFENFGMFYENIAVPLPDEKGNINQILTVTLNITERKKAEAEAKETHSRNQAFVNNLPGVTYQFAMNPDGKFYFTFISEQADKIFGLNRDEILNNPERITEFIHPDDVQSFYAALNGSIQTLSQFHWLGRIVSPLKVSWLEAFSLPRKQPDGKIIWDGIQFNVTERIEREKQIKRFDEQLKLIVKNAPIVLWSLDKEGRFTLSEGKGLEKLGFNAGDAVGLSAFELYSFNQNFIEHLHKTFAGEAVEFETFDIYLDQPVAFRHLLQPTHNEHGEITGLLAISIDVTEEYRSKESELRYRALANNIPGAVFQAEAQPDLSRKITFVGESIRQFGITPEEMVGYNNNAARFLHPDDLQSFLNAIGQSFLTLKPFCWEGRALIHGKSIWVEVAATPRRSEEGVVYWEGIILDISERKDVATKLTEALRIANIATVEVDLRKRELIYSDRHLEQLGTTLEQLGSRNVKFEEIGKGFILKEDIPILSAQLSKADVAESQRGFVNEPFEYRIMRGDTGEIRTLYVFKTEVFRDEEGNATHAIATIQDITERKVLESALRDLNESLERQVQERTAELRQSEQLYRAIAENYPTGMVGIYDRAFVLLFTDGMEYQRLGIDAAHLIDRSLFDVYPEQVAPVIASYFNRAFNGETVNFELSLGGSDYFYLASPIRGEDDVIEQILVVTQNITERKQTERLLRENEERYRLVLEQTGQLVYDLDLETGVNKWSGAVEQLTGYLPSEYQISVDEWAVYIHPDDRAEATRLLEETMQSGLPYRVEYRYRRKDGSYFWVEDNGVYLKDDTGKPFRMLGAMKDITVQKEMEIEKNRITEKAMQAQKLESVGTLASGIAHEFNNLLAIISLSNEQIQSSAKSSAILKNAQTIQKTIERGSHIARQLLDFSRSEQTEKQPIELSRLLDEITVTLRRLLKRTVTVQGIQSVEQAWMMGNDKQIYQVLLNLGINAGDAMPNGGILSYSLSTSRYNDKLYAVIRVKDTGTGIPPEVRARMFEPFFTTKGVGKGTGLGLSIVHGIVSAHDGQIEVETELGKGTTFTLMFPMLELSKVADEERLTVSEVGGEETLLIVEDEPFLRTLLAKMLRTKGYTIIEAADGEEALTIFEKKKKKIDLVLTDMGMPNMDGYELLKKLRRKMKKVKVIVMTGYMDSEQSEKLAKEQVDVVSKPFDIAEMSATIRNVLMR
jgi:PAS domain S-box-containing protein